MSEVMINDRNLEAKQEKRLWYTDLQRDFSSKMYTLFQTNWAEKYTVLVQSIEGAFPCAGTENSNSKDRV